MSAGEKNKDWERGVFLTGNRARTVSDCTHTHSEREKEKEKEKKNPRDSFLFLTFSWVYGACGSAK